jgi:hypothetical protein
MTGERDKAEFAYREVLRALESQDRDLDGLRARSALILSGGAVGAGLFVTDEQSGWFFGMALVFFAVLALATAMIYRPIAWKSHLNMYEVVPDYVQDRQVDPAEMLTDFAVHLQEDYLANLDRLAERLRWYIIGLAAFGVTITSLLVDRLVD